MSSPVEQFLEKVPPESIRVGGLVFGTHPREQEVSPGELMVALIEDDVDSDRRWTLPAGKLDMEKDQVLGSRTGVLLAGAERVVHAKTAIPAGALDTLSTAPFFYNRESLSGSGNDAVVLFPFFSKVVELTPVAHKDIDGPQDMLRATWVSLARAKEVLPHKIDQRLMDSPRTVRLVGQVKNDLKVSKEAAA